MCPTVDKLATCSKRLTTQLLIPTNTPPLRENGKQEPSVADLFTCSKLLTKHLKQPRRRSNRSTSNLVSHSPRVHHNRCNHVGVTLKQRADTGIELEGALNKEDIKVPR